MMHPDFSDARPELYACLQSALDACRDGGRLELDSMEGLRGEEPRVLEALSRAAAKECSAAADILAELDAPSAFGLDLVALRARWASGNATLPERVSERGFVYLHGFASSPGSYKGQLIADPLKADGFDVRVPDLNEDDFTHLTLSRALRLIRRNLLDQTLLIGSSMGGYLSVLASEDPRVRGTLLMAPAFEMGERLFGRHGEAAMAEWKAAGTTLVEHFALKRPVPLAYGFYEDALTHPGQPQIRPPSRIWAGLRDDVVPIELIRSAVERWATDGIELFELDDEHALTTAAPHVLAQARAWGAP